MRRRGIRKQRRRGEEEGKGRKGGKSRAEEETGYMRGKVKYLRMSLWISVFKRWSSYFPMQRGGKELSIYY